MRRAAMAVVFLGVLAGVALWLLPRRGGFALADVAEAMARVRSAHFVGWDPGHPSSGGRDRREGWVERRRARSVEGDVIDEFFDETRFVEIRRENGAVYATIRPVPAELAKLLQDEMGYLKAFLWPQAAQEALERRGETVTKWERQRLSDGRVVVVVDLTAGDRMTRMTVDEATDLILRIEDYRGDTLVGAIEKIEYNVEIPEEVFQVAIPKGAIVVDTSSLSPASADQRSKYAGWLATAKQIEGAVILSQFGPGSESHGSCGTPFHHDLTFGVIDNGGMILVYLPDRNAYRVFGRALVHEGNSQRVVDNAEFAPATPPDVTVKQWKAEEARRDAEEKRRQPPPEVRAQWDAKAKELRAAGAKHLWFGGRGWPRVDLAFEPVTERFIDVWYSPARNEYYVMGKARVYDRRGFDQTVEDGWIKVPGPAPKWDD